MTSGQVTKGTDEKLLALLRAGWKVQYVINERNGEARVVVKHPKGYTGARESPLDQFDPEGALTKAVEVVKSWALAARQHGDPDGQPIQLPEDARHPATG